MVQRRHVFFFAGFDPKGPGHYHALYRAQARLQGAVTGVAYTVGPRQGSRASHRVQWAVEADPGGPAGKSIEAIDNLDGGAATQASIEMLRWDDIVRRHWQRGHWSPVLGALPAVAHYLRSGAMKRLYALSRPPVLAAGLPIAAGALAIALAMGVAVAAGLMLQRADGLAGLPAIAVSLALAVLLAYAAGGVFRRIRIDWFVRLVRFSHRIARGQVPELEQRMAEFGAVIADRVRRGAADGDGAPAEVLVVGHSVGAITAAMALAAALQRDPGLCEHGPQVSLLTLGQCLPMLGVLPGAEPFRAGLLALAGSGIDWLDVSSPLDWAAFPLVDPVAASVPGHAARDWHPRLVSPRFHLLFSEAGQARLRAERFRVHLQYLHASERPGRYDYFAITAGPLALRERFADEPRHDPDSRAP
ncbi:MAG: hypothetical protein ABI699_10860 [Caldimonas sp.]